MPKMAADHAGRFVYVVSDSYRGALTVFRRDGMTGNLSFVDSLHDELHEDRTGLRMACSVASSPDGRHLYVGTRGDGRLSVFERNAESGRAELMQRLENGRQGVEGLRSGEQIALTPDGKHLFVAASSDNAIAAFARDVHSGRLEFLGAVKDGRDEIDCLQHVTSLAVSPDGKHLYTTSANATVAVFEIRAPQS
jgi:6-phosphogluconolactonase (cycloisomerase 2 family)